MKVRLQKPVFVAISLALAVNSFVILLPSPQATTSRSRRMPSRVASSGRRGKRGRLFLL